MTASAPHAIALAMSPPVRMPPSAITFTYLPVSSRCCTRAAAASAIAVAWGTPTPSTPRVVRDLVVVAHALRRQRAGRKHARLLDLTDSCSDQLRLDRLLVDLLHAARRLLLREPRDLVQLALGVLVSREDALEVAHAEAAEIAELA